VRAFGRMRSLSHFLFADIAASQMAEFAVCLPLLIVVVVGIFDFGEAFNVKQKLNGLRHGHCRQSASLRTNERPAECEHLYSTCMRSRREFPVSLPVLVSLHLA